VPGIVEGCASGLWWNGSGQLPGEGQLELYMEYDVAKGLNGSEG
jgi:hypothetical protein